MRDELNHRVGLVLLADRELDLNRIPSELKRVADDEVNRVLPEKLVDLAREVPDVKVVCVLHELERNLRGRRDGFRLRLYSLWLQRRDSPLSLRNDPVVARMLGRPRISCSARRHLDEDPLLFSGLAALEVLRVVVGLDVQLLCPGPNHICLTLLPARGLRSLEFFHHPLKPSVRASG